ncbi:hypothetical protein ABT160_42415 [Streptomyces sp. NPDC001941]|uniref:hypothetical protein n=1 Tax=Streptomyces sp. NPDC001941 TaxID=3154659 RepID=UPI003317A626
MDRRRYAVFAQADDVVAILRTALGAHGWQERAALAYLTDDREHALELLPEAFRLALWRDSPSPALTVISRIPREQCLSLLELLILTEIDHVTDYANLATLAADCGACVAPRSHEPAVPPQPRRRRLPGEITVYEATWHWLHDPVPPGAGIPRRPAGFAAYHALHISRHRQPPPWQPWPGRWN